MQLVAHQTEQVFKVGLRGICLERTSLFWFTPLEMAIYAWKKLPGYHHVRRSGDASACPTSDQSTVDATSLEICRHDAIVLMKLECFLDQNHRSLTFFGSWNLFKLNQIKLKHYTKNI